MTTVRICVEEFRDITDCTRRFPFYCYARGKIINPADKVGQPDGPRHTRSYSAYVIVPDAYLEMWRVDPNSREAKKIVFQYFREELEQCVGQGDLRDEYKFEMGQPSGNCPYNPDCINDDVPQEFDVEVEFPIGFRPP